MYKSLVVRGRRLWGSAGMLESAGTAAPPKPIFMNEHDSSYKYIFSHAEAVS